MFQRPRAEPLEFDFAIDTEVAPSDGIKAKLSGEIDIQTGPALEEFLRVALNTYRGVELDMSETAFMDSNGLKVLIDSGADATTDPRLLVVAASPPIIKLFELTDLAERFGLPAST